MAHAKQQLNLDLNLVEPSPDNGNHVPIAFPQYERLVEERLHLRAMPTFVPNKNRPIHRWFSYTQGFSADLVDYALNSLGVGKARHVFDPFCGAGTTLLSCQERGVNASGTDISPLVVFVANVKLCRGYKLPALRRAIDAITRTPLGEPTIALPNLPLLSQAYPPENLRAIAALKERIQRIEERSVRDFLTLGLLAILERVSFLRKHGAHYRFLNNNNVGNRSPVFEVTSDVAGVLRQQLLMMHRDLEWVASRWQGTARSRAMVGDARDLSHLSEASVDCVITSPPYLNRDNYIAQYKIELFLFDFVTDTADFRRLTRRSLRSHVEAAPTIPIRVDSPELRRLLMELSQRDLNNDKILEMVEGYFLDMHRVLQELSRVVVPKGRVILVVANVRWGGVVIPVDALLARFAESLGFRLEKIIVTRYKGNSPQQMRRYGKIPVRESILVLERMA